MMASESYYYEKIDKTCVEFLWLLTIINAVNISSTVYILVINTFWLTIIIVVVIVIIIGFLLIFIIKTNKESFPLPQKTKL